MRSDMVHVASKAASHWFHNRPGKPGRQAKDVEDLPSRESTHRVARSNVKKHFHESHLKPVERWLRTQLGRAWSAVLHDLRTVLDTRSDKGFLLAKYAERLVEIKARFGDNGELLNSAGVYPILGFYVNPHSGILEFVPSIRSTKAHKAEALAQLEATRVLVSKTKQLHKMDGLWYWVELAPITAPIYAEIKHFDGTISFSPFPSEICEDVVTGDSFYLVPVSGWTKRSLTERYGISDYYAVKKYQASSADIRRHVKS